MQDNICETCVDVADCPIYKVARETQIQHIPASAFGCLWHTTQEELDARMNERKQDDDHPEWNTMLRLHARALGQ